MPEPLCPERTITCCCCGERHRLRRARSAMVRRWIGIAITARRGFPSSTARQQLACASTAVRLTVGGRGVSMREGFADAGVRQVRVDGQERGPREAVVEAALKPLLQVLRDWATPDA